MPSEDQQYADRAFDIAVGAIEPGAVDLEQRVFARRPFDGQASFVQVLSAAMRAEPVSMKGRDVSAGGMCTISSRKLEGGAHGALLLTKSDGQQIIIGADIVYCNLRGPGEYECGVKFTAKPAGVTLKDFRGEDGKLPSHAA